MDDSQVAAALAAQLAASIGSQRYDVWFGPQTTLAVENGVLCVRSGSPFESECLRKQFGEQILRNWQAMAGASAVVEYGTDASLAKPAPLRTNAATTQHSLSLRERAGVREHSNNAGHPHSALSQGERVLNSTAEPVQTMNGSRPDASLSSFVLGPSNEYAFRAAELTATCRQQASPLFFWGATGVGKTHLLRAIQREFRRHQPRATAVYLTAEQFTTHFVQALRGTGLPSFRQKCRSSDLLLIDDVHFFAGKQRTAEELQHTVDTLLRDGRQLVLASDRSIADLRASLGHELCSRISGGLPCHLEAPEFATRVEIARRQAAEMDLAASDDVLKLLATQITAGARELQGALHRLQAESRAFKVPVTREMAERTLADVARHSTRPVRLADVEKVVCDVFGVEPTQLRSDVKRRALNEPRMLAMWLARKYTRSAWSEIGQFFGRRSHSSVIAAHRRVEKLITSQAEIGLSDRTCRVEDAIRKLESALRCA